MFHLYEICAAPQCIFLKRKTFGRFQRGKNPVSTRFHYVEVAVACLINACYGFGNIAVILFLCLMFCIKLCAREVVFAAYFHNTVERERHTHMCSADFLLHYMCLEEKLTYSYDFHADMCVIAFAVWVWYDVCMCMCPTCMCECAPVCM